MVFYVNFTMVKKSTVLEILVFIIYHFIVMLRNHRKKQCYDSKYPIISCHRNAVKKL